MSNRRAKICKGWNRHRPRAIEHRSNVRRRIELTVANDTPFVGLR